MSLIATMGDKMFSYDKELGDYLKKEINTSSRGKVKSILQQMRNDKPPSDDEHFEVNTLTKMFFILEAHGYSSLAEDVALVLNRRFVEERAQEFVYKEIAEGAAYMNRKKAASGMPTSTKR